MPDSAIHHIRLTVSDLSRAKQFWIRLLGFMGFVFVNENDDRVCYESADTGLRFLLCEAPVEYKHELFQQGKLGFHHLAFSARSHEQVDEFYTLLTQLGVPTEGPPEFYTYSPGYYAVYFHDPDGLKFELVHAPR